MRVFLNQKLFLFCSGFLLLCSPLYASETDTPINYIAAGVGLEQLTYSETIPDLEITSSDTDLTNWLLFLEGRKTLQSFFLGAKAHIPFAIDESQEYWTRAGDFEQSNSLTYGWIRVDAHGGYLLHPLLNPYVGIAWSYAKQERSNFINSNSTDPITVTATEKVYSFSALLGIQGNIPLASKWSLTYLAEYLLPFSSNTTNNSLPGWEVSNTNGYAYSITARLNYAFSKTLSAALQFSTGKQVWDGSDWMEVNGRRAKWPENNTDFLNCLINIYRYF